MKGGSNWKASDLRRALKAPGQLPQSSPAFGYRAAEMLLSAQVGVLPLGKETTGCVSPPRRWGKSDVSVLLAGEDSGRAPPIQDPLSSDWYSLS